MKKKKIYNNNFSKPEDLNSNIFNNIYKKYNYNTELTHINDDDKIILQFKKLKKNAIIPKYAYFGDAGLDIFSSDNYILKIGERKQISTGISLSLVKKIENEKFILVNNYYTAILPKSGLSKIGIDIIHGTVDNNYTGEIKVLVVNNTKKKLFIKSNTKIAQLVFHKICTPNIIMTIDKLMNTNRGSNGFGSTGLLNN